MAWPPGRVLLTGVLHVCLILAAAAAVTIGLLGHGLLLEDRRTIAVAAPVISGTASLSSAFTYPYRGAADLAFPNELYRPAAIASLGLDTRLMGRSTAAMRAGNILLHAANAVLVYALAAALSAGMVPGLLAGLLFAVHPIATEPVATLAGRATLLSTFFLLISVLLGVAAVKRRGVRFVLCALGAALGASMGAFSHEAIFVAPLLTGAVVLLAGRKAESSADERRERLLAAVALAGLQAVAIVMVVLMRAEMLGYVFRTAPPDDRALAALAFVNNPLQFAPATSRFLTAMRIAGKGAGLMVFPRTLSADYSYDAIPVATGAPSMSDMGLLIIAASYLGLTVWSARRRPAFAGALIWSALTFLMVSSLGFPAGDIFKETYLYLPSIGFAIVAGALLGRPAGLSRTGRMASGVRGAVAAALLILFSARFASRCRDWVDDEHIYRAAVAASPASARAQSNFGLALRQTARFEQAIAAYRRALEIAPSMTGSRLSLARALMRLRRCEEAIREFRIVTESDPEISIAWSGLGLAQEAEGRLTEAEDSFRKAQALSSGANREAALGLTRLASRVRKSSKQV